MFKDRIDAGEKLAEALGKYRDDPDAVVLGLPRGGVVLAAVVADKLKIPLDVVCPRKIGFPFNKEYAIGAITETGEFIQSGSFSYDGISESYLENEIAVEMEKAQRRLTMFRRGRPPRNLKEITVILVDDGLATGLTMRAAIITVQREGAKKIVIAVPVAPGETVAAFKELVDEVICLEIPFEFQAVGQFYRDFRQVEDGEVVALMTKGGVNG